MRRPVKPFAVEVRRAGRRVPQSFIPTRETEGPPQPDYFTPPAPANSPQPGSPTQSTPPRRVLQDLSEPAKDPLAERLQQLESRLARRGRPPGSKNKARGTLPVDLSTLFETVEPRSAVALVPIPFKRRPREQRFGWIKKKLRRGERWKRRLPKLLW
jgi:hypothetical protein